MTGRWVADTLALYRDVCQRSLRLFARNPVLVVPALATLGVGILWPMLAWLGFLGGLVMVVVESMCWSALLASTGDAIRSGRVTMADVRTGFIAYLGDVLNVRFILWLGSWALASAPPQAQILVLVAAIVFLNAVPELIYLGRYGTVDLIGASYRFMAENWIEWAPPNVLLAAALVAGPGWLLPLLLPFGWTVASWCVLGLVSTVLTLGLLVRGILFLELTRSGRRARAFRRAAS